MDRAAPASFQVNLVNAIASSTQARATQQLAEDITLVLTCCGRPALLEKTIRSFVTMNQHPIKECVIIEDSGQTGINEPFKELMPWPTRTIYNPTNLGQMRSIDIAYAHVSTPYIFHCEDDWQFYQPRFIERSLEVLKNDSRVVTVWLRAHNDTNRHPIEPAGDGRYYYLKLAYHGVWHGFTFNPGLRRTADAMLLHPFSTLPPLVGKNDLMMVGEADISIYYQLLGFRAAITDNKEGFIRHIGEVDHIALPWEVRRVSGVARRVVDLTRYYWRRRPWKSRG